MGIDNWLIDLLMWRKHEPVLWNYRYNIPAHLFLNESLDYLCTNRIKLDPNYCPPRLEKKNYIEDTDYPEILNSSISGKVSLNLDVALVIFGYFSIGKLKSLRRVSNKWRNLINKVLLTRKTFCRLCFKEYYPEIENPEPCVYHPGIIGALRSGYHYSCCMHPDPEAQVLFFLFKFFHFF